MVNDSPGPRGIEFRLGEGRALLLDVGLTLLHVVEPVEAVYRRLGRPFGIDRSPDAIRVAFLEALTTPVDGLQYAGDGRSFWHGVIEASTGVDHPEFLDQAYRHYGRADAWQIAENAMDCVAAAQRAGARVGIVSNWDLRLRRLLADLEILDAFDTVVVSAEERLEKPDPSVFRVAFARLGVAPADVVHVGDSYGHDVVGAQRAGCLGWQYGEDVPNFAVLARRLGLSL